jgi:hypothetical protein
MTMSDPALDNDDSAATHLPWETIDAAEDTMVEEAEPLHATTDAQQGFLTPWEQDSDAPEPSSQEAESGASSRLDSNFDDFKIEREFEADPEPDFAPEYAMDPPTMAPAASGGGWTLPILCAGIALIACCVLIPQADTNRRLVYERQKLQVELKNIEQQVNVNQEFVKRVADDPILAQRLAQRQMKVIPEGSHVLDLAHDSDGMSPFQLVNVAPPAPMPPYKPVAGTLANICYGPHSRLYLIGLSLGMIATGLVLGYAPQKT